jgi:PAS domain S-box-containing protein
MQARTAFARLCGALAPGVFGAAIIVILMIAMSRQQHAATGSILSSLTVLDQVATVRADIATAVGESRSFIIRRTAESSDRFETAFAHASKDIAGLGALLAKRRADQAAVGRVLPVLDSRLQALRDLFDRVQASAARPEETSLGTDAEGVGETVLSAAGELEDLERSLLIESARRASRTSLRNSAVLIAGSILLSLSGLAILAIARSRDRERRRVAALQERNSELAAEVRLQTAALAEREASFRLLAEGAGDMVVRVRADGRQHYVSPASLRIVGRSPELLIGHCLAEILHPDDQAGFEAFGARLLAGTVEADTLTARVIHPERGEIWVEIGARACRSPEDGNPDGYIGIVRDVTQRKQNEDAQKQSEKLQAIGGIAAGVAHDFNNILQSIVGGLELVQDDIAVDSSAYECAGIALNAAKRGSTLTHHLLSYARKQVLKPEILDVTAFLSEVAMLLRRSLGPHIEVRIRADGPSLRVLVDANKLQTALLNLAINAAHAMGSGGTLTISAGVQREEDRNWIVIAVADTGCGMDKETRARAFEPFFTTKGLEGTGLGLSMVQGFAEQSGGKAAITSAPGQGTTVRVMLPAIAPPVGQQASRAPQAAAGSAALLLGDDADDVLVTTGAFLEKAGYIVVRARMADSALALLRQAERCDVLVTDYAMPGTNGVDLIAAARRVVPGLPAIVITGFAAVERTRELPPGTVVLQKPFQRSDLLAALDYVLWTAREAERTPRRVPAAAFIERAEAG